MKINKQIEQIWKRISEYKKVTLFTHVNPDGDTIGSSVALRELIKLNLPGIQVKISGDAYPNNLNWLKKNQNVSDKYIESSLAILIDGSSIKRTFDNRIMDSKEIIKIDHHSPEGNEWSMAIDGDTYPACGEIIYMFIKQLDLKFNKAALEAIYTAIWTDTSGLVERHPTKNTRSAIKWLEDNGINREEIIESLQLPQEDRDLIDVLTDDYSTNGAVVYKINDTEVSNYIYRPATEQFFKSIDSEFYVFAAKTNGYYRVGLRSKNKDVSKIAEKFGGGGHKTSSGCIARDKETVVKIIIDLAMSVK
ncbi:MAG: DHH family phosphoesterase [Mycoplasmataceae bacterium]|nr:DHH family phosphoesterase [Mycoplasmataceae bacterium]